MAMVGQWRPIIAIDRVSVGRAWATSIPSFYSKKLVNAK
jgi:hypothetical protein